MKERPILMTPENAQKCFDGTKTQTRRIVKPQPKVVHNWTGEYLQTEQIFRDGAPGLRCPYGQVGDRLWVREAWQEKAWSLTELNRAGFLSAPKNPYETYLNQALYAIHKGGYNMAIGDPGKWTPSIHMPRWACRTVLEITDIRVERVQSISEEDAKAEGASFHDGHGIGHSGWRHDFKDVYADARSSFCALWTSINGPTSWEENPYVWVIGFKKVLTP